MRIYVGMCKNTVLYPEQTESKIPITGNTDTVNTETQLSTDKKKIIN